MGEEIALPGGFVNEVVLKDGSVRRGTGANTAFVHRLLRHFEHGGWDGAPRLLGIDAEGREMLTYIEGHVPQGPDRTAYTESDASLARLAELVREFHDLTAGTALAAGRETVCHNDLDPRNTVYADARPGALPIAIIDWDLAAPGDRLHDLAHLCWQHLRLGTQVTDLPETARRLRLMCDAYGLDRAGRSGLVEAVLWWQERCWRGIEEQAEAGDAAMIGLRAAGVPAVVRADHDWVRRHRVELEARIRSGSEKTLSYGDGIVDLDP